MKRTMAAFLSFMLLCAAGAAACTTAIIAGRATPDGRPLLFKHRDSDSLSNRLAYFTDGDFPYIGLVNASDTAGREIWAGVNGEGFAIMNAATYNQNLGDTSSVKDREGLVMKRALQECATLEDFERLLGTLPRPMGLDASFGAIDAAGGAAYYETGNQGFTKYDANDPAVAPFGYLIRTNYAYRGEREEDYGLIRSETAAALLAEAYATGALSHGFLIDRVSRSLVHSLTRTDLTHVLPPAGEAHFVFFRDYIPRHSSVSTVVVQGVRGGESAELVTMWTVLGFQLCTVALPAWVAGGERLPEVLRDDGTGRAPLCETALELKRRCFPIDRGSGPSYLDLAAVQNAAGDGILQMIRPLERELMDEAGRCLASWRASGINRGEIQALYRLIDGRVREGYRRLFGL